MTLGQLIRKHRQAKQLSLVDLARQVRVSPSHLSRVERGQRGGVTSNKMLARLATALEVSPDEVFCAAGKLPNDLVLWLIRQPRTLARLRREMAA